MDTGSLLVLVAFAAFAAGAAVSAYIARDVIRHKRRLAYLGFVATLNRHAEGISEDTDPRRIAAGLQREAGLWQRSADALAFRPKTSRE